MMSDASVFIAGPVGHGWELVSAPPLASTPQQLGSDDPFADRLDAATAFEQTGRLDEAERILAEIITADPAHAPALNLLGIVNYRQNRPQRAAEVLEQAIAAAPDNALFHRNIAEFYRALGRHDDAVAAAKRAAALSPEDPICFHNLGVIHYHRCELDEAIASAERALSLDPDLAGAHFGIAEAALLSGDFARGWDEYEWRTRLETAPPLLPFTDRAQWNGRTLGRGEPLLLIADQGYGDVIQFGRYIPWVAARCAVFVIACSAELQPLITGLAGGASVFDHWEQAPAFAEYCPLSSLPRLAGTQLASIPAPVPYIHAEADRRTAWSERLGVLLPRGYRRIGLAWAGRPTHQNDRARSMSLDAFGPLAALPDIALVSLQKGPAQREIGNYWGEAPLLNLGPELRDFGDTAAVVANLDLVIAVDTAVVHLAGAMGKPVWILLPYAPDWRWLLDRNDSPWYPTARLFRQTATRQWMPVVAAAVTALLANGSARR